MKRREFMALLSGAAAAWPLSGTRSRSTEGRNERYSEIAKEFVQMPVDIIITSGTATMRAAMLATSVTPIVFAAAGDPVASGLVASPCPTGRQRHRPIAPVHRAYKQTNRTFTRDLSRSPSFGNLGQPRQSVRRTGDGRG
jgi:hypothetical protein